MKKVLVIIRSQNLWTFTRYLAMTAALTGLCCLVVFGMETYRSSNTAAATKTQSQLEQENQRLADILSSILPRERKVIHECSTRLLNMPQPDFHEFSLEQVMTEEKNIPYTLVASLPQYLRPLYSPQWKDFFFRWWLDFPAKVSDAHHRLFVYYGGASNIFDFEGGLGLNLEQEQRFPIDYHNQINFLIYHFEVSSVKKLGNQLVLVGQPVRSGMQVISVNVEDVIPVGRKDFNFLFQLATPGGYEVDYLYGSYSRNPLPIKPKPLDHPFPAFKEKIENLEQLQNENACLKEQLAGFIPPAPLDEASCRPLGITPAPVSPKTLKQAVGSDKKTTFTLKYQDTGYQRPVYHPLWKEKSEKGWAYLPRKICEGLHALFVLPAAADEQADLLGSLGFFERYEPLTDMELGILVYNFQVHHVLLLPNRILLEGIPSRNGIQLLSLNRQVAGGKALVELVTPDGAELDWAVIPQE